MKNWLIVVAIRLLIVGCSQTSNISPTVSSLSTINQNSIKAGKQTSLPETSQKACGDILPKNTSLYPINLYPVFVVYSEKNLELVTRRFCEDAFKKYREDIGKNAIQVASFISIENANKFKAKLSQSFNEIDIGSPTIIKENPDTKISSSLTQEQVIAKARLAPEQAKKLISVLGTGKDFEKDNVVVIPTDIPDDYKVDELTVWQGESRPTHRALAGRYRIVYKNSSGACFEIGGGELSPRGEGMQKREEISNIQSSALGSVTLGFTDSDREDGSKQMEFAETMGLHLAGRNEYSFNSPVVGASCKMMKVQDAKRVVQSLQFINP